MSEPNETIPGGYYIGVDGTPHDANGNPLSVIEAVQEPTAPEQPQKPAATRKSRTAHAYPAPTEQQPEQPATTGDAPAETAQSEPQPEQPATAEG